MNMKLNKSATQALVISLVIMAVGLVAWLLRGASAYYASDARMIDFTQLWLSMGAAVVFSLLFGIARYSLAAGVALAVGTAHDLLVTYAICGVIALVLPQSATLPLALLLTVAWTYCQTLPRLRVARQIYRSTSLRDTTMDEIAVKAANSNPMPLIVAPAMALLIFIAVAVSGNVRLLASILPLAVALVVSIYSARAISPFVWSAVAATRRPARRRA